MLLAGALAKLLNKYNACSYCLLTYVAMPKNGSERTPQ